MSRWLSVKAYKWTFLTECRHMELHWLLLRFEPFRVQLTNKTRYQDTSENIFDLKSNHHSLMTAIGV